MAANNKYVNFNLVYPLRNIASIKVVTELLSRTVFYKALAIDKLFYLPTIAVSKNLRTLEKRTAATIRLLRIPAEIHDVLLSFITPLAMELLSFVHVNIVIKDKMRFFNYAFNVQYFQWTMDGRIDRTKTLEFELRNMRGLDYDVEDTFKLACRHCAEECVERLWYELPKDAKSRLCKVMRRANDYVVAYWTCKFASEDQEMSEDVDTDDFQHMSTECASTEIMMMSSMLRTNLAAVKLFWPRHPIEDRNKDIVMWLRHMIIDNRVLPNYEETNTFSDTLGYLLGQLTAEQQSELFVDSGGKILRTLFYAWPWQRYFLPMFKVIVAHMSASFYRSILRDIAFEISHHRKGVVGLLTDLWYSSPLRLREDVVRYFMRFSEEITLLPILIQAGEIETLKLILSSVSIRDANYIIVNCADLDEVCALLNKEKFHLIDDLLVLLTRREVEQFKRVLIRSHADELSTDWLFNGNWTAFENFVKWACPSEQDEIDVKRSINILCITRSLVALSNYKVLDKFLGWFFRTEEDLKKFKNHFAYVERFNVVMRLSDCEWDLYLEYIDWCMDSAENIQEFKLHSSNFTSLENTVYQIFKETFNVEFVDKYVAWCLISKKKIRQFKKDYTRSEIGVVTLWKFLDKCPYTMYRMDTGWVLLEKFIAWCSPLEEDIAAEWKERLARIRGKILGPDRTSPYYSLLGNKEAFYNLIDAHTEVSK